MEEFTYEGLVFTPWKTLKGKSSDFDQISKRIKDIGITPEQWNYDEFYKVAEQHDVGNIDLFKVDDKVVIPARNYLFGYR